MGFVSYCLFMIDILSYVHSMVESMFGYGFSFPMFFYFWNFSLDEENGFGYEKSCRRFYSIIGGDI